MRTERSHRPPFGLELCLPTELRKGSREREAPSVEFLLSSDRAAESKRRSQAPPRGINHKSNSHFNQLRSSKSSSPSSQMYSAPPSLHTVRGGAWTQTKGRCANMHVLPHSETYLCHHLIPQRLCGFPYCLFHKKNA